MIDPAEAGKNILLILQQSPERYRCFGVWWWPVKAFLRQHYGREQLYMLGSYVDPYPPALPELDLPTMLERALGEYAHNVRYNLNRSTVEDLDGEAYTLVDEDASL